VECGFRGYWTHPDIQRIIREEEFNAFMSASVDIMRVATPDFAGARIEGQQYRFFPDVSNDPPIWITLRQNLQRSKLTMIMRVSKETPQAEVKKAASIYWEQTVEFKNPPTVYDSNTIYWMKPHNDGPPDDDDSDAQPETDTLDAIPHIATPTFKPATGSFVRSLSSDDLSKLSKAPVPQKSADCLVKWTVNFALTVITHWAPEDAPIEVVTARAAASIGLKEAGWRIRQGDRFHIYCTDSSIVSEAAIHFGNMEWRGKVELRSQFRNLLREHGLSLKSQGSGKSDPHIGKETRGALNVSNCQTIHSIRHCQKIVKFGSI
jgi:hypothetical protein